jgi:hypothetical protein
MAMAGVEAANAQAVAYPNLGFGGFGGSWDGQSFGAAEGRATAPLGPMFGGQLSGLAGTLGGTPYWQGAGQLFWRNPATGLFGAYSAATQQQGVTTWRFGPEAELYLNRATLSAVGGWKLVSGSGAGMFLQAKASFYLTPDFKLFGGYIFDGGSFGNAGFEFRLAGGGLAFFGEGRFGSSASGAWVGLRAYLGGPPTKSSGST